MRYKISQERDFFRNLFEREVIGIKRYESKDILLLLKQKQMGV